MIIGLVFIIRNHSTFIMNKLLGTFFFFLVIFHTLAAQEGKIYRSLSSAFAAPENVHILQLPNLNLTHLPDSFKFLVNLEELDLSWNDFTVFPSVLTSLKRIKRIDLSYNNISSVAADFAKLDSLELFIYKSNKDELSEFLKKNFQRHYIYTSLKNALKSPKKVYRLHLDSEYVENASSISPKITRLKNLVELSITDCIELSVLPEQLGKLQNLKYLDISGNAIEVLPSSLWDLKKLKELKLSWNRIDELDEEIGNLVNLEVLYLGGDDTQWYANTDDDHIIVYAQCLRSENNNIKVFPESFRMLKNLKKLKLVHLGLDSIPDCITKLSRLEELDFTYNNLEELPAMIGDLKSLRYLWLGRNSIKVLPQEIGYLSKLEILDLGGDNNSPPSPFQKIKSSLGGVQYYSYDGNLLEYIPESIGLLKELRVLNLRKNKIKDLPMSIADLPKLIEINLSKNGLDKLPKSIFRMKNLKYLYIRDNDFEEECTNKLSKELPSCSIIY
jgi:Leucine-rich repeat (LRR) protein